MAEGTAPPPSVNPEASQPRVPARRGSSRAVGRIAFRLAVHLAAWVPFVTGAVEAVRSHWRPVGDSAAIALRSWDVLTAHGPLVGQATRLAHGVYDPGPLQYWLQAIPVHLDPRYGVLWGAALWCVIASSLAIEAAWSALGWPAGLVAAGVIVGLVLWQPVIALQPFWNPWFGATFFVAALAAGWAVLSGRRRWWVVLVVTGSVASQAHLMYALASGALVVLALAACLADCIRAKAGYRWLIAGLLACVACWIAPLIQNITGKPGNLTQLLHHQGTGQLTGFAFGLKALTASVQPPPPWWESSHALAGMGAATLIAHRSVAFAVAALALPAVVLVVAVRPLRSRPLGALAALTLLESGAAVATYARIPVKSTSLRTLSYLDTLTLPLGVLCWLCAGSAVVLTGYQLIRRRRPRPATPVAQSGLLGRAAAWPARWAVLSAAGLAAAAPIAVISSRAVTQGASAADAQPGNVIGLASQQIAKALPGQQIALQVTDPKAQAQVVPLAMGIAWALKTSGYRPELVNQHAARLLGSGYQYSGQKIPLAKVHVHATGLSVRVNPLPAEYALAEQGRAEHGLALPCARCATTDYLSR